MPTPCARDGKGPGLPYGLPDLIEPGGSIHNLLPTPSAVAYGSNRSPSPGATPRPGLHLLASQLLPTLTAGGCTGSMSGSDRDTWRPALESAVQGYPPTEGGKPALPAPLVPTPTVGDSRSPANATAGRIPGHTGHALTDGARLLPTPRASDTGTPGRKAGAGFRPPLSQVLLPTPRATDGEKGCPGQRGSHGDLTLPSAAVRVPARMLPTPRANDGHGRCVHGEGGADLITAMAQLHDEVAGFGALDEARWGVYAAAIARWEVLLDRAVPEPTQTGRHGKPVLAPPFVEWLMGVPHGWVTGLDLPRTGALRVLGNGVVPQQAAAAVRALLCPCRWQVIA